MKFPFKFIFYSVLFLKWKIKKLWSAFQAR